MSLFGSQFIEHLSLDGENYEPINTSSHTVTHDDSHSHFAGLSSDLMNEYLSGEKNADDLTRIDWQTNDTTPVDSNPFGTPFSTNDASDDDDCIKLFVGSLPYSSTEVELKPLFDQFGEVLEFTIQRDRNGKSKGCAWLKFKTKEECDDCIKSLHEQYCVGNMKNALQVKYANGEEEKAENKIFIGGLPFAITTEELGEVFAAYGRLREVFLIRKKDGSPTGSAFVKFELRSAAKAAISNVTALPYKDGHTYRLRISFANKSLGRSAQKTNDSVPFNPTAVNTVNAQQNMSPAVDNATAIAASLQLALGGTLTSQQIGALQAVLSTVSAQQQPFNPHNINTNAGILNNGAFGQSSNSIINNGGGQFGNVGMTGGGANLNPRAKLFVGCVPYSVTKADLAAVFSNYGPLLDVYILTDSQNRSKGAAFITYNSRDDATRAITGLHGYQFPGSSRGLNVSFSRNAM